MSAPTSPMPLGPSRGGPADPAPAPVRTPGAVVALYRLVLRHQLTRGRVFLFGTIVAGCTLLGWILTHAGSDADRAEATVAVISALGLGLVVPVVALVLGSASLGTWVDDETLVYVWLRPVARWRIAVASVAASVTVAVPITAMALGLLAAIGSGVAGDVLTGTIVSAALGGLAYVSVFVLVGLLIRRALLWGLVYVFVWEFFVARAGAGAARLSINSYAASLLAHYSGQEIRLADRALSSSYIVLIAVSVVAAALTTWRLRQANVA